MQNIIFWSKIEKYSKSVQFWHPDNVANTAADGVAMGRQLTLVWSVDLYISLSSA